MIPGYSTLPDISADHNELHRKALQLASPFIDVIATAAPTKDTLPAGWFQRYDDGTNRRIYHNLNGTIYYWGLTAA